MASSDSLRKSYQRKNIITGNLFCALDGQNGYFYIEAADNTYMFTIYNVCSTGKASNFPWFHHSSTVLMHTKSLSHSK